MSWCHHDVMHSFPPLTPPLLQASRVTDACLQVKAMGTELRARPQLYAGTPQLELDSYVTLTHAVKLRVSHTHIAQAVPNIVCWPEVWNWLSMMAPSDAFPLQTS